MPLRGVRIVTVEEWLQLPLATVNLSEMGAEVIRVETLSRIVVRNLGPYPENQVGERFWNQGGTHHTWSRSKKSVTLDLKTPEGQEAFKELVSISDVVTENNRPGIMERFGLDYETLRKVKPDLIMLRTTGYGQTGDWREYGAFARTVEAVTSLSHMTGYSDGPPVRANTSYVDITTCWNNMLVVLMALHHRNKTGEGTFIDMSMYESGVSNVGVALLERQANGSNPERSGNKHRWMVPHGCYQCAGEDNWVTIAVRSEDEWSVLCEVMNRLDLKEDPRFATYEERWNHRDELDGYIEEWTKQSSQHQVMHLLQQRGIPAAAVLNSRDTLTDPHLRSRDFFEKHTDPAEVEGVGARWYASRPYKFSKSYGEIRMVSQLGEHNEYVLNDLLGMEESATSAMAEAGIIGTEPTNVEQLDPQPVNIEAQLRMGSIAFHDPNYKKVLGIE